MKLRNVRKFALSIVNKIENLGGIFPLIAFYSCEEFKQLAHDLLILESVDRDNVGGLINISQNPITNATTSVYIMNKSEGTDKINDARSRYNYVVSITDEDVEVHKGLPISFVPVPEHAKHRMFRYVLNRNVFYGVTNKSGSTYITQHLSNSSKKKDTEYREDALKFMPRILSRRSSVYKFTVVRNPFSRIVSCYKDIIAGEMYLPYNRNVFFRRCIGLPISGFISFEDFINHLELFGFAWTPEAEHWLPQVTCCSYSSIAYNDIGRFEQLNTFLNTTVAPILKAAGDDRDVIFPANKPERVSGASLSWRDYYTNDSIRNRVYKLYEVDFDTFKYSNNL